MNPRAAVSVVGIGDDGCASLTGRAANAVARAQVLVGGERHLAFFPQFSGTRIVLKGNLDAAIERVALLAEEHTVCIIASGDPLFFGIGARILRSIGADHVDFVPSPSAVQWAFARTGIPWDDAVVISVHGRCADGFVTRIRSMSKVAVLTDAESSPSQLAARLIEYGDTAWSAWVCERLAGAGERVRAFSVAALAEAQDIDSLNVLLLLRPDGWRAPPVIPYLDEARFARRMPKKGLISKREVRMLSLATLSLRDGDVVWDIGAGSGSVSIEAALLVPRGQVYAIEVDPEGVEICRENKRAHGVDNVHVVHGRAPEACEHLPKPDAVFIGGSKGSMTPIITAALHALRAGGRLVVNAVTLENVAEAYSALHAQALDPEVTLVQIARGVPLAHYQRYEALNPIHIMAVTKPQPASESAS